MQPKAPNANAKGVIFMLKNQNKKKRTYNYAHSKRKRGLIMYKQAKQTKGYYTNSVYMGFVPSIGKYLQFESETAYINYIREKGE